MRRSVPRGLVENKARQSVARALTCSGPLTARGLAKATERPVAFSRYHVRVLARAGAATPSLVGAANGDEVVWTLTAENLPKRAREVLLGEISLAVWGELVNMVLFENLRDAAELGARLGLSRREVARYMKLMRADGVKGLPRFGLGNKPDRISDLPEWITEPRSSDETDAPRDDRDDRR